MTIPSAGNDPIAQGIRQAIDNRHRQINGEQNHNQPIKLEVANAVNQMAFRDCWSAICS